MGMSEETIELIAYLLLTVVPIVMLGLQILLSTRKHLGFGFIIPILWGLLGLSMILNNREDGSIFTSEMILFFVLGEIVLFGVLFLCKYIQKRKLHNLSSKGSHKKKIA